MATAEQTRESDYITRARQAAKQLWQAELALEALQAEWNALNYSATLAAGVGENEGILAADVGSVVFDTADAVRTLFGQGHATNIAKLL